jgi:serine/threonine-protein kinase RsbW
MEFSSANEPILNHIEFQTTTGSASADEVLAWFGTLNEPPLPDQVVWWQCQTAFKEAFDNVIEHAHEGLPPDTPIMAEATRFATRIEVRIWDYGQAFDLVKKLSELPDFDQNRRDGGRGLKIIAVVADQVSYTRTDDDRNCFLLVKHY